MGNSFDALEGRDTAAHAGVGQVAVSRRGYDKLPDIPCVHRRVQAVLMIRSVLG